jgi:hypothetical protein
MDGLTSVVYAAALNFFRTCIYVTPEEADGMIGFGCDVTDVICPAQVVANDDT